VIFCASAGPPNWEDLLPVSVPVRLAALMRDDGKVHVSHGRDPDSGAMSLTFCQFGLPPALVLLGDGRRWLRFGACRVRHNSRGRTRTGPGAFGCRQKRASLICLPLSGDDARTDRRQDGQRKGR